MKSLVHTEELCSGSVPLEHAPGAKPLVCIGLYATINLKMSVAIQSKREELPIAFPGVIINSLSLRHDTVSGIQLDKQQFQSPQFPDYQISFQD